MPDIISIFVNFKVTHDDAVLFHDSQWLLPC